MKPAYPFPRHLRTRYAEHMRFLKNVNGVDVWWDTRAPDTRLPYLFVYSKQEAHWVGESELQRYGDPTPLAAVSPSKAPYQFSLAHHNLIS